MAGPTLPAPAVLDPDQFENLVEVFYLSRQALIASGAWALYDLLLSLDLEIRYVWLKPWGFSTFFFFWTRYFGFSILLVTILGGVLTQPYPNVCVTHIRCLMIYYGGAWGGVITMSTVSLIMLLRIRAIYTGNRTVVAVLAILLLGYIATECSIFGTDYAAPWIPPLEYYSLGLNGCFASTNSPQMIGTWVARLGMDAIMLGFVLYKSYEQYKDGWSSTLVDLLIRHNIMAFVLVVFIQLANLLVTLFADATILGIGFAIATDVVVGSRLLLHTREAVYKRSDNDETTVVELSDLRIGPSTSISAGLSSDDHEARQWMSVYSVTDGVGPGRRLSDAANVWSDESVPSIVVNGPFA